VLSTLFVDQLVKVMMRGQLQTPVVGELLKLGAVNTVPAAFSVLPVLVELAGLGIAGTMLYGLVSRMTDAPPLAHRLQAIGLAVVCGALLSNLLDRLVIGSVFNYAQILQLPLFNLAHAALLAGTGLVLVSVLRKQ
jgi:lipoprotein signal peptidase